MELEEKDRWTIINALHSYAQEQNDAREKQLIIQLAIRIETAEHILVP